MLESLRYFLLKDIVSFGKYSVNILNVILISTIIAIDIIVTHLFTKFIKSKKLYEKKFTKVVTRVLKIIVHILAFIGIIFLLGVKLSNIFDLLDALLNQRLFRVSNTDISLLTIIVIVVVIYASSKISGLVRNYLNVKFFPRFKIDEGVQFTLSKIIGYSIIIIGILIALQGLGIRLSALTVFAGVLGVGIGFGMQNITANVVSGLVIIFERPIKEGDMVRLNDKIGEVLKINLRATIIKTIYNEHLIVPNSEFINSTVENMSCSDLKLRIKVNVGAAYSSDPELVKQALVEAARDTENVMNYPEPSVLFKEFGDSSLNFELLAWIDNPLKKFVTESDLHFAVIKKFREKGIEIPFPQRDVYIKYK